MKVLKWRKAGYIVYIYCYTYIYIWGGQWRRWVRHFATSLEAPGSIPGGESLSPHSVALGVHSASNRNEYLGISLGGRVGISAVLVVPNVKLRMKAQHALSLHDMLRESFTFIFTFYCPRFVMTAKAARTADKTISSNWFRAT